MTPSLPQRLFGLDPRSLTAFRVALGVLLVLDAGDRMRDVRELLTDDGVLPASMAAMGSWRPSLPFAAGGRELAALWLMLLGVAGAAIAAGWRTRAWIAVAWVVTVSVQARNPMVLYGGDIVLRLLLFWGFFLAAAGGLDRYASVDRAKGRVPVEAGNTPLLTGATAAYTWQIAVLYFATYVYKRGGTWEEGTAGWFAVHMDSFTGAIGVALRQAPWLLRLGTWATLLMEAVGPFLLFVPWRTPWFRGVVVAFFLAFHLGLEIALQIGWFPWVSIACWLPLVPGGWWDRLGWRGEEAAAPPTRGVLAWAGHAVPVAFVLLVTWWNVAGWWPGAVPSVRGQARKVVYQLRLDQTWDMYAPNPSFVDGWFRVDAVTAGGREVDLVTGDTPTAAKPARLWDRYGSSRFNKHMRGLWDVEAVDQREPYLDWMCRTWNQRALPRDRVSEVRMVLVRERSPRPGMTTQPEPVEQVVARHTCDDAPR